MLSLHSFMIYFGIYALLVVVPGPGVLAIVARALGSGFRACIPAAIGTAVGDWTWMTLSVVGLSVVAQAMGKAFIVVKWAGAAYLIYLGIRYWRAPVGDLPDIVESKAHQGFLSQLFVTLSNPKAMAFFLAILPTFVELKSLNAVGYLQLCAATAIIIPTIMLAYAALASRVRVFLTGRRARGRINKIAAGFLVLVGLDVAVS